MNVALMVMNAKRYPKPHQGKQGVSGNGCNTKPLYSRLPSAGSSCQSSRVVGDDAKSVTRSKEKRSQLLSLKHKSHRAEVQKNAKQVHGNWSEHISSSGKVYYYNCVTEVSQWERPDEWICEFRSLVSNRTDAMKCQKTKLRSKQSNCDFHLIMGHHRSLEPLSATGQIASLAVKQTSVISVPADSDNVVQQYHRSASEFISSLTPEDFDCIPLSQKDASKFSKSPKQISDSGFFLSAEPRKEYENLCEEKDSSRNQSSNNGLNISVPFCDMNSVKNAHESCPLILPSQDSMDTSLQSDNIVDDISLTNVANAVSALEKMIAIATVNEPLTAHFESSKELPLSSSFNEQLILKFDLMERMLANPFRTATSERLALRALQLLQKLDINILLPKQQHRLQELIQHLVRMLNSNQNPFKDSPAVKYSNQAPLTLTAGQTGPVTVADNVPAVGSHCGADGLNDPSCMRDLSSVQSVFHESFHHKPAVFSGKVIADTAPITVLTSSLVNYFDVCLIRHVVGWQSETFERQAYRTAEEAHLLGSLHCTRISGELKRLRSTIRSNEIIGMINEQRAASLSQLIQEFS